MVQGDGVKAGVNMKAVLMSLNTAFLPISLSNVSSNTKSLCLFSLTTVWQFCVNFGVIIGHLMLKI